MSQIDSYDHGFAGYLAGRPIYVLDEDASDFNVKKDGILLGGGGGEQAAVRIVNNYLAVQYFIDDVVEYMKKPYTGYKAELIKKLETWSEKEYDKLKFEDRLDFIHWQPEDYVEFVDEVRKLHNIEQHLKSPRFTNIVIMANIGELIFFSLSRLVPKYNKFITKYRQEIPELYGNVIYRPPGYRINGGRRLDKTTDRVNWFISAYKDKNGIPS